MAKEILTNPSPFSPKIDPGTTATLCSFTIYLEKSQEDIPKEEILSHYLKKVLHLNIIYYMYNIQSFKSVMPRRQLLKEFNEIIFKSDRLYSKEHIWAREDKNQIVISITD